MNIANPLQPELRRKSARRIWSPRRVSRFSSATRLWSIKEGLKVLDITFQAQPQVVSGATVPLKMRGIFMSRGRTRMSPAASRAGHRGYRKPEHPALRQVFNAGA